MNVFEKNHVKIGTQFLIRELSGTYELGDKVVYEVFKVGKRRIVKGLYESLLNESWNILYVRKEKI